MQFLNESAINFILRLLGALCCVVFSFTAFALKDSFKPASDTHIAVFIAIAACIFIPPFVAIGLLCERTALGAGIGVSLFVALAGYFLYAITHYPP